MPEETHEEGLAALHEDYHAYQMRFRGVRRKSTPLSYTEWLEHKAVRMANLLGKMDEKLEQAEEDRDCYKDAVFASREIIDELTLRLKRFQDFSLSLQAQMRVGNVSEVLRLVLHYCCWN
jgi:hypothetical protein